MKRTGGFTLVELQVALVLIALMSVLLVGALRLSSQTWTKVTQKQDVLEHRLLVSQLLRKHLANIRFLRARDEEGHLINGFMGNDEQFSFIAPYPSFKNDGEMYWWTLKTLWNDDQDVYQLVMDYLPYDTKQPLHIDNDNNLTYDEQLPARLVISDNIQMTDIEYYRRDTLGVEGWQDDWEEVADKPLVIRFTLRETDALGNQTMLPEIAVAPRFARQQLNANVGQ